MKLLINKYCLALLVISVWFLMPSNTVYAAAPHIEGHVYKKGTTQPLDKAVWVQWTDARGSIRYVQTAPNGSFHFESWQTMEGAHLIAAECATQIDSNLDGANESRKAYTVPRKAGEDVSYTGDCHGHAWGCQENRHTWTAVTPSSMKGKFTFVALDIPDGEWINGQYLAKIDNLPPKIDIGIYYWEDQTPPPSPTPTPTKIECGQPCTGPPNQIDQQCVDRCPICAPGPNPLQNVCQAVPTATPTPTKIECGRPCTGPPNQIDQQCIERCPICAPGPDPNQKTCQPVATATPTPSPTATRTPTPTATPTLTPTPTINQAACQCDSISYTGTFAPGSLMTFYIKTKVENPDTYRAKVLDVVYHLKINDVEKEQKQVEATYSERKTINNVPTDFYITAWTYQLPSDLSGINYFKVYADPSDIHCGWRTAYQKPAIMVLAANSANTSNGVFSSLVNFFRSLFGQDAGFSVQAPPVPTPTPTATITPTPSVNRSLQLGTFGPYGITNQTCTGLSFWIDYDWAPAQTP